jgi:hypothetical protein
VTCVFHNIGQKIHEILNSYHQILKKIQGTVYKELGHVLDMACEGPSTFGGFDHKTAAWVFITIYMTTQFFP